MKKRIYLWIRFFLVLMLGSGLFAYAMFQGGFISWFLFFSFTPILLYQVLFLCYPLQNWDVSRALSQHTSYAGRSITVEITIKRRVPFPVFYCVMEDILPDTLTRYDAGRKKDDKQTVASTVQKNRTQKMLLFPLCRRTIRTSYSLEQIPRGMHEFNEIRIRASDLFGFMHKEELYDDRLSLLVYPNRRILNWTNDILSLGKGQHTSYKRGNNARIAAEVREYLPGDKLTWIDWKQSAKKQQVMTKEFEQEKNLGVVIVLDACTSAPFSAFEGAVEMTASLIDTFQENNATRLEFLSIGTEIIRFPVHKSSREMESAQRYLAQVQQEVGVFSFLEEVQKKRIAIPKQELLFLVRCVPSLEENNLIWKDLTKQFKHIYVLLILQEGAYTEELRQKIKQLSLYSVKVMVVTDQMLWKDKTMEVGK